MLEGCKLRVTCQGSYVEGEKIDADSKKSWSRVKIECLKFKVLQGSYHSEE